MTREEVLSLPPGTRLDDAVHERVRGLPVIWRGEAPLANEVGLVGLNPVPKYSDSSPAALLAAEDAVDRSEYAHFQVSYSHYRGWYASVRGSERDDATLKSDTVAVWGQTLGHALSKALVAATFPEERTK